MDELTLLDWKRRVFELYAEVRAEPEPEQAWRRWRDVRDELFRIHPTSGEEPYAFTRFARARFELGSLDLFWLEGYGGGVFLSFADATSGTETYGACRYLLDTVKGADLGERDGRLVLDFNFAYNPSCAYDPRWVCPLAPPGNRLAAPIRGGERSGK